MKRLFIALFLVSAIAFAQETTTTTTTSPPEDSAVVKASKASTRKKAKPKHIITNADLKKPSNKPMPPKATEAGTVVDVKADPHDARTAELRVQHAAEEKVADAEKKVLTLEREIARVEQDYYEENDPTRRDKELAKRFELTKKQLAAARGELTDAREALAKLTDKPRD
jgi:hypothetical protein